MSDDEPNAPTDFEEDSGSGAPVEEGAPMWMATFGDMMSLLLVFFILMFSMSELKMDRFMLAAQSMNTAMGSTSPKPVEKPMGLMEDPDDPDLNLENPGMNEGATKSPVESDGTEEDWLERISEAYLEMIAKRLEQFVQDEGLEADVRVERSETGVYLRMQTTALFPSGEAGPRVEGIQLLTDLAAVTSSLDVPVIVSGHADNTPIATASFPSNWELSAARAAGVARLLVSAGQDPTSTRVESWGEFRPVADNATAEGRAQNRRVELFYSLQSIREAALTWAQAGAPPTAVPSTAVPPVGLP